MVFENRFQIKRKYKDNLGNVVREVIEVKVNFLSFISHSNVIKFIVRVYPFKVGIKNLTITHDMLFSS